MRARSRSVGLVGHLPSVGCWDVTARDCVGRGSGGSRCRGRNGGAGGAGVGEDGHPRVAIPVMHCELLDAAKAEYR